MITLPNNCRIGKFSVYPSNWKTSRANYSLMWRIVYWFYDDNINKKKQIVIKGMNRFETLKEKQGAVKTLIENEILQLKDKGYNPFTKTFTAQIDNEISEYTPFVEALQYALNNLHAEVETKRDIKSCLKQITASIKALHYDKLTISQVRRKHIRLIFDQCERSKDYWSNNLFNHYRKYLSILFKQLVEVEVVDYNPVSQVQKRSSLKKIRQTLSKEERIKVNDHLYKNYYEFWRFVQIFYASGAREIELMNVRIKDVDLSNQTFNVIIKKGRSIREVVKVITNDSLCLWQELIGDLTSAKNAQVDNYFIFSRGLKPGIKSISRYQLTKRWKVHVKQKLGITADLYSTKHLRSTNISEKLGTQTAAELNSHTSDTMVIKIYDTNYNKRKLEKLKNINDSFAG